MIPYLGDYTEDSTIYVMFNTFTSDDPSASCTITDLVNTDIHIHKDDGLTQRNNAAGITVSVDFDGVTGSHLLKIDSSDNTVAGFWVKAHDYFVRVEGTTVDAATINSVVCHFSIENRYMRGTESANTTVPDAAGVAPTAAEIRQEMDTNSTKMAPSQTLNDYKADVSGLAPASEYDTEIARLDVAVSTRNSVVPDVAGTAAGLHTTTDGLVTTVDGVVDAILVDTDELQGNQSNWATATSVTVSDKTGFSLSTAGIKAMWDQLTSALTTASTIGKLLVDNIDATISSRNSVTPDAAGVAPTAAEINAEIVDVMTIDVTTEMTQAAPPEEPTFQEMWAYLYFRLRNKCTTTATEDAMWDNAGTIKLVKAEISDDGTTLTKGEYTSGA